MNQNGSLSLSHAEAELQTIAMDLNTTINDIKVAIKEWPTCSLFLFC
jgi:hypothetical protein